MGLLVVCTVLAPWAGAQEPSSCCFYLASQYDWERKLGFYLDFEGERLGELPVILGIADGKAWRFATYQPGFVAEREYRVSAVIAPDKAQLLLDGKVVAESPGAWRPAAASVGINYRPAWASEPGDWLVIAERIRIAVLRGENEIQHLDFNFSDSAARPVPLQLMEPGDPRSRSAVLETKPGDVVQIEATLRLGWADLRHWAPFIDRYGQCRYAQWPEKVRDDEDLRSDIAREDALLAEMPASPDFDEYGGWLKAGWREEPTGFFRVARRNGYWWLITPRGDPCFYLGVCVLPAQTWPTTPVSDREFIFEWLPPREEPWSAAWSANHWGVHDGTEYVCFHACNLIRKYGARDWMQQAEARAIRRLGAWGFSGGGKWGAPASLVSTPVLGIGSTPILVKHPDVFDPQVCDIFRRELERQIAPQRDNPRVLGWSLGNEYGEIVTRGEIGQILAKPAQTPAKRALLNYAVDTLYRGSLADLAAAWKLEAASREALYAASPRPPMQDLEHLRCFYADRYYGFIYRTVKEIDRNHLYLGFWIVPEWWQSEEDWRLIARHCDVIGYDRYDRDYESPLLRRLQAESDKPTLCGEFSFPAWYDGMRGFGRYGTYARDDAEAGELYYRWVQAAARDPYCVGLMLFEYRDQSLTGRGPGRGERLSFGEHFAFGIITETDRPKWPLVRRMREANLEAARWRLAASK